MSESKHTPGPWKVIPEGRAQSPWIVGDAEEGSIADCEPPGPWITEETALANARLISAAPDLLALLEELIDIEGPQPGTGGWAGKVRAAIAKAKGETK